MANIFYVSVRDSDGDVMPSTSVGAYLDFACTQLATLVAPGPTGNPFTTDADGDREVYVTDGNVEMLYFRAVGQTVIVPIRCANKVVFNDYTTDTTPADADVFIFEVVATGVKYKLTFSDLVAAIAAKMITNGTFVESDNDLTTTNIQLTASTADPSGGTDGDIWLKVT